MENKLQLIETADYTLAVSDEEIKEGDWIFNYSGLKYNEQVISKASKNAEVNWKDNLIINDGQKSIRECIKKIIAYQPKNNTPKLDLPLFPEMVVEDDVENLAEISSEKHHYAFGQQSEFYQLGFIEGYKAATRTYSKDDLRKAFEYGTNEGYTYRHLEEVDEIPEELSDEEWNSFIKNLKTPKWFVAQKEYLSNTGEWKDVLLPSEWEVDTQVRLKTCLDSDGYPVLVGYYI